MQTGDRRIAAGGRHRVPPGAGVLVLVLVSGALATGCGGGEEDVTTAAQRPSSAPAGAAREPGRSGSGDRQRPDHAGRARGASDQAGQGGDDDGEGARAPEQPDGVATDNGRDGHGKRDRQTDAGARARGDGGGSGGGGQSGQSDAEAQAEHPATSPNGSGGSSATDAEQAAGKG